MTKRGIRSVKEFDVYIKKKIKMETEWSISEVFGMDKEKIEEEILTLDNPQWNDVANMLKERHNFTEFQAGFAIGSLFILHNTVENKPPIMIQKPKMKFGM